MGQEHQPGCNKLKIIFVFHFLVLSITVLSTYTYSPEVSEVRGANSNKDPILFSHLLESRH